MRIPAGTALFLLALQSGAAGQVAGSTTPAACAALTGLQVPGVALTVTKAEWLAAGTTPPAGRGAAAPAATLPAYCRLDGVIDRRTGAAGAAYGIGFALALPEKWNGRFLLQGGGGLNGSVQAPMGASAAGGNPGLARGFAVASTDTGHQGGDTAWMAVPEQVTDFAGRAMHETTVAGKALTAAYYGAAPRFAAGVLPDGSRMRT